MAGELEEPRRRHPGDHHDLLLGAHRKVRGVAGFDAQALQNRRSERQQHRLIERTRRQREQPRADTIPAAVRELGEEAEAHQRPDQMEGRAGVQAHLHADLRQADPMRPASHGVEDRRGALQ
jgi:hypothetical protein